MIDDDDDEDDDRSTYITFQVPSATSLAWWRWGPDAKVLPVVNCRLTPVITSVTATICRRRGHVASTSEGKHRLQSGIR